MAVNYEDERLQKVGTDKQAALSEVEETYGGMIDSVDEKYQGLIGASEEWKNTQSQIQQEQTDFTIEQLEQQKEQAQKDYTKEQSAAYVDWQKQSSEHGVNAEQMAAMGMTGTGYSESSQVSMYNTYQNRVATARASYDAAVLNYNNAIKEARLQNSSALAEIALTALQEQLQLSLEGFQYKNSLVLEQANKKAEVSSTYDGYYLDVLSQLADEAANNDQVFSQWLAYLETAYPSGYVTDADLWSELVDTYGEETLKEAGFSRGGKIEGPGGGYAVNTAYYQGDINPDADTFGTFSNGYQPKGISGHGLLSKSGETVELTVKNLAGEEVTKTQNVWKAEDGTLWYWNGPQNKYIQIGGQSGGAATSNPGGPGAINVGKDFRQKAAW